MDAAGPLALVILGALIGWVVMLVIEYIVLKPHWIAQGQTMADSEAGAEIHESLVEIERMHQEQLATLTEISNQLAANRLAIEAAESSDFDPASMQDAINHIANTLETHGQAFQHLESLAAQDSAALQDELNQATNALLDDVRVALTDIETMHAKQLATLEIHSQTLEHLEALATQRATSAESINASLSQQLDTLVSSLREDIRVSVDDAVEDVTSPSDNLTDIKGVGPSYANRLRAAGIHSFAQLAALTTEELNALLRMDGKLVEGWINQARVIVSGRNKLEKLS